MANEISYSGSLSFTKGVESARLSGSGRADQTGTDYVQATQAIGDSQETLVKGDIGTIGWVAVRNMDDALSVQLGATTGVYSILLGPGQFFMGPWDTVNVYALGTSASPLTKIEYLLIEA